MAYERVNGGLLMDLIILPIFALSMSSLLLPTLCVTMIGHPFAITREATHIGVLQTTNITFWDRTSILKDVHLEMSTYR